MPKRESGPGEAELGRLYHDQHLTVAAIAAHYGVAPAMVHTWLVAGDVPRRPPAATRRRDISDGRIIRLYAGERRSAADVARRLMGSPSMVYARLAGAGVPRRPRGPRHPARTPDQELDELYRNQGLSVRQMAPLSECAPRRCTPG